MLSYFAKRGEEPMTKLIAMPNEINEIDNLISAVDAVLFGIENMSVNCIDIEEKELESLVKKIKAAGKEIFVSLNKNMHNKDLKSAEKILKKCSKLHVDGILYCDVAILQLCHKLSLDLPLVWSAEHLVTNYHTINYWQRFNISHVFLSNEITKEEILDIKKNVTIPVIVQCFGYLPMYVSKRLAVTNYLRFFKLKTSAKKFYLFKEDKTYPIVERDIGTEIYSAYILNAICEYLIYKDNKIDYVLLSGFEIEVDKFIRVIELFKTVDDSNKESYKLEIEHMFENSSQGFLHTETIYQVKKNEK